MSDSVKKNDDYPPTGRSPGKSEQAPKKQDPKGSGCLNIYMCGVGGQGIGLLSETLIRAADYAGQQAIGVDTHGLAQRGGTVQSHLRLGEDLFSPLVMEHEADLVISLERNEALRGMQEYGKPGGTVIYFDAAWQPLGVRLQQEQSVTGEQLAEEARHLGITLIRVYEQLEDARMQNVALLKEVAARRLLPGVGKEQMIRALKDLLQPRVLEKNLLLFNA